MKRGNVSVFIAATLGIIVLTSSLLGAPLVQVKKPDPVVLSWLQNVNWDERHHIDFYGTLLNNLVMAYPTLAKTYSIGHSWREKPISCIEITNGDSSKPKVEMAVFGNIHGGEQESGEAAAYVAWWLVMNYGTNSTAKKILDNYRIYVVPVINPDGYANSFLVNTRSNFRPIDKNGNGYPADDPYCDTDGDGIIAQVYTGPASATPSGANPPAGFVNLGREGKDFDLNGILSDDVQESGIDMNRNFDHMWSMYDPTVTPYIGYKIKQSTAGPWAASEPEVQAVQNFLESKNVKSLISLHTGMQCVDYGWGWTKDHLPEPYYTFMSTTARAMAAAANSSTGPEHGGYFSRQMSTGYPTTAELTDWSQGRLGISSYMMEVIASGTGKFAWGTTSAPYTWTYKGTWSPRPGLTFDNVWFRTRPIMPTVPAGQQHLVSNGVLAACLVMFNSIPPHS